MSKKSKKYTIAFMCRILLVTRQGYYKWLKNRDKPYKHALLLARMKQILAEDEENKNYGTVRMHEALKFKFKIKESQSTVARVMRENGMIQPKKRNPNSLTKADKEAQKSDNLLKQNFTAEKPFEKCVGDITQLPTADGPLYISGMFDCFDNSCLGLAMDDNMRAELVESTINQAAQRYNLRKSIFHSDRGSQYTSEIVRKAMGKHGIIQSMNSAAGRCHDNAKCESMWARFKVEKIYGKESTAKMSMEAVKALVFRYFMSYWNNRRICSANGGLPPAEKRRRYFEGESKAA